MKEIVKNSLMKEYMNKTNLASSMVEENKIISYTYGYLDGYFEEKIYEKYVLESNNQGYYESYNTGCQDGIKDGSYVNKSALQKQKEEFIKELVIFDMINNRCRKDLTNQAQSIYDKYMKYGEISLDNNTIEIPKDKRKL